MTERQRWRTALDAGASIAMIAAAAGLLWATFGRQPAARPGRQAQQAAALPAAPVSLAEAPIRGSAAARVALIVFSDFQCPYCGVFARETMPALDAAYVASGKVLVAFRHVPGGPRHPHARAASEAAECAGTQGRFCDMHDRLFANQRALDRDSVLSGARGLKLDEASFRQCIDGDMKSRIDRDVAQAKLLAITSTPTFFVGLREGTGDVRVMERFAGARPIEDFQKVLDKLLVTATASK